MTIVDQLETSTSVKEIAVLFSWNKELGRRPAIGPALCRRNVKKIEEPTIFRSSGPKEPPS